MKSNLWFTLPVCLLLLVTGALASCSGDDSSGGSAAEDDTGRPSRPGANDDEDGGAEEGADDAGGSDTAGPAPDDVAVPDASTGCEPGWLGCVNPTTIGQCSTDGTQLFETPCTEGTYCVNNNGVCTAGVCEPYRQRCVGTAGEREICNPDASGFGPTSGCGPEEYCDDGRCLIRGCLPSVMFAFDGSSSMTSEFGTIQASINRITSANPDVAFGLSMFPTGTGCSISGDRTGLFGGPVIDWPNVPISPSGAAQITEWFANNGASGGATPLIATLEWFADNVTEVFGAFPENGHLIIMSEGADTCRSACKQDERDFNGEERVACLVDYLGEATRRLRDQGVKVYVIGYRFSEDQRILNSIAENGGTPFTEFIYARNEDSLFAAFESVIGNAKICDE